ncbi:SAM-dependent methyltransferase [Xenophilus azovorans]|uniref:SAM-dependent methyltransferase n=1 Tax=Xenophilus azovorans TaxID=151755 RepID=UPI0006908B47|nr:methyltransferase domain-containing protein [Xenophilus azovorans]
MLRRFAVFLPFACAAAAAAAQWVEEVPFITTPDHVTLGMLELAGVGPRDHLIDLGSGDGRIVITAARRFGASGLGVEIVPELVQRSRAHAQQAGVADRVAFRTEDLFQTDLSRATVVTMYLLPEINLQLRPRLLALAPGTRIVSHDWDLGDWRPDRTATLPVPDKAVGREKLSRVHLWRVPAPVDGLWCAGPVALRIAQRFQHYRAQIEGPVPHRWEGRIHGAQLPPPVGGPPRPGLRWREGVLEVAQGAPGVAPGSRFTQAEAAACPAG